ncbi:MAG: recombinase family protein [Blastocatellia bacterium]
MGTYDTRQASTETQLEECLKLAAKEGYLVPEEFRFEDRHTGKHLHQRPELAKARELVRSKKAEAFFVYDTDRLSRGGVGHLSIIVEEIVEYGAMFYCVLEPYENTHEGQVMLALRAYRAAIEIEKIRDRTMRGRIKKIQNGQIPGQGGNQYGYRMNKETWVKEIYEPEAMVVRRIFDLIANGHSTRTVAGLLTKEKVMVPSASLERKKVARCWHAACIGTMIRTPAYKGMNRVHVWTVEDKTGRAIKRPLDEHIYLPNTARTIVTPELWEQANASVKKNVGDATRNYKDFVLLRGMVWCSRCGKKAHIVRGGNNRKVCLFRCHSHVVKGEKCGAGTVSSRWLCTQAGSDVFRLLKDPARIEEMLRVARENEQKTDGFEKDIVKLQRRVEDIEASRKRLVKRLAQIEPEDEDLFQTELARLREEKAQTIKTIEDMQENISRLKDQAPTFPTLKVILDYIAEHGDPETWPDSEKRHLFELARLRVCFDGREWFWQLPSGMVVMPGESANR